MDDSYWCHKKIWRNAVTGKGSKAKGSAFENAVGAALRKALGLSKPFFTRLPRNRGNEGEFWYPEVGVFPYAVECKHLREISWWQLFRPDTDALITRWWNKIDEESKAMNPPRFPMLIFKQNNSPICCGVRNLFGSDEPPVVELPEHKLRIYRFETVLSVLSLRAQQTHVYNF